MSQIMIASGKVKTVGSQSLTITGAASSGGKVNITTSAAHGLETGDVVYISGVVGTVEANGRWSITVIDSTHFTLDNSTFVTAYTSGGTAAHVGYVTASQLIDNTVFSTVPNNLAFKFRMTSQSSGGKFRFHFQDTGDTAFLTAMAGPGGSFFGQHTNQFESTWSARFYDFPDFRVASSGNKTRLMIQFGSPVAGQSLTFDSWLEY